MNLGPVFGFFMLLILLAPVGGFAIGAWLTASAHIVIRRNFLKRGGLILLAYYASFAAAYAAAVATVSSTAHDVSEHSTCFLVLLAPVLGGVVIAMAATMRGTKLLDLCSKCGYDLRQIASSNCPECGNARFPGRGRNHEPRRADEPAGGGGAQSGV